MRTNTLRLLALLELLQSRSKVTGSEIASHLGVDKRAVRRYIKSLQNIGIPIQAERGRYGAYTLDRGFKIPPIMFNEEEIIALILGLMTIKAFQFPVSQIGITGAIAKIQRVMPVSLLEQTLSIQERVQFHYAYAMTEVNPEIVISLTNAMKNHNRIQMSYRSWQDKLSTRNIDPYGVVLYEGFWYLVGYCYLRYAIRTFRVDRVEQITSTEFRFKRPEAFDAEAHVVDALQKPPNIQSIRVLMFASLEEVQKALPPEIGQFKVVDDGIVFERPVYRMDWIAALLFNLDFSFRVLEPDNLKERLRVLNQRQIEVLD
ncbi:MAG: YafY family protein [Chloroflexota bacterium]